MHVFRWMNKITLIINGIIKSGKLIVCASTTRYSIKAVCTLSITASLNTFSCNCDLDRRKMQVKSIGLMDVLACFFWKSTILST